MVRTSLKDAGIDIRGHYITESAYNPVGGNFSAGRYTQQFDFGADFDLNRLVGIPGATVRVTFTDRAGRSLSADALGNNLFPVQELYGAGQNFRLAGLSYQQELLDKRVVFEIGWAPLGDEFGSNPIYCHFQSGAICGHPKSLSTNSSGWHNFPTAQWGTRVKVAPDPEYYLTTGVYQVNPYGGNHNAGFDLSFRGTGVIVPAEIGWLPGRDGTRLPGEYVFGGYYDSSNAPDLLTDVSGSSAGLTGAPFTSHNGRWGLYAMATQMVYREPSSTKRGLTLFGVATVSDPATATFRYYFAAGGSYQGTFRGRDDDFVSLLFAYVRINNRLTNHQEDLSTVSSQPVGIQKYESVVEMDYNVAIAPWLQLRPNWQYVIHPAATGKVPDAFVFGLYSRVVF